MPFSLPNPSVPTNGQLGDATPILQNELAIAQAISAFDGSQINAKSIVEAALADAINSRLRGSETLGSFVQSGCIWSGVSGLNGTMTGGTIYVNGYRVVVSGIGSNTFASSSDTYVYIDYLGNITYQAVATNSASPSPTPNAILVGIIITNGTTITQANQGGLATTAPVVSASVLMVCDSIGNLIYPNSPFQRLIGYRQLTTGGSSGSTVDVLINGLSLPVINSGHNVKVSFYNRFIAEATGTNDCYITLYRGASSGALTTIVQQAKVYAINNATGQSIFIEQPDSTTGTNYFSAAMHVGSASTVSFDAAATTPAYIKAELG